MFELELFPARDGDALVLTWGDPDTPRRMLIDAGRESTAGHLKKAFDKKNDDEHVFELLVVSHIDADHIAGVIKMLSDPERTIVFKEVWFNAYHHLVDGSWEAFGANQGETLSDLLEQNQGLWNTRFGGKAVALETDRELPRIEIEGLTLTVLSPTRERLQQLAGEWGHWLEVETVRRGETGGKEPPPPVVIPKGYEAFGAAPDVEALAGARFVEDGKAANGSSIALAAEFEGKRVLLAADAHPSVLAASLALLPEEERRFDLVKLPHHGSKANVSPALFELLDCYRFAISTDGSRHSHPNPEAIARVLIASKGSKQLYFNYRHAEAVVWDDANLMEKFDYSCTFCADDDSGRLAIPI